MPGNTLSTIQPGDDEPDRQIDEELLVVGDREGADPDHPEINPPYNGDRWRGYNIKDLGKEALLAANTAGVDPMVGTHRVMPTNMYPNKAGQRTLRAHWPNRRRLGFGT